MIEAAEATRNPRTLAFALYAYGVAFRNVDPDRAREALHRSLVLAHDSGNRGDESNLAAMLAGLEALHGDPLAAFDYVTMAIRNHHDSGNHTHVRLDMAELAVILHRLRRHESAATIAGFALTPLTKAHPELNAAITHLREVLGDQDYEALAHKGEAMTTAAMVTYAYDQIDQARTELNAVSK